METDRKKYYVLNGSTHIALLSYFIKVYITYAMFLVYLLQKLLFNLKKCKNMLKIENRGCHGNGGVDQTNICIFVHHSTEIKNRERFRKIYFFYFQPILMVNTTKKESRPCIRRFFKDCKRNGLANIFRSVGHTNVPLIFLKDQYFVTYVTNIFK